MIGYLDTSAFVPLLLTESTTAGCRRFWDIADDIVTSRITYVETAAALAAAARANRLMPIEQDCCLDKLDELWAELSVIEVDDLLIRRAAALAHRCALRGNDAVHCASAALIPDSDVVAASSDRKLLAAWVGLGVATFNPNQPGDRRHQGVAGARG